MYVIYGQTFRIERISGDLWHNRADGRRVGETKRAANAARFTFLIICFLLIYLNALLSGLRDNLSPTFPLQPKLFQTLASAQTFYR